MAKDKLSAWKAREMLKDKTAHGHPLTEKQKHYFGMVAHGINKYEEGGWLDRYNDGGPIQPNYNDSYVSIPPNFVGMGNDISGRSYSPAWGGAFANGGEIMNVANLKNPIAQNGTSLPGSVGNMYARIGAPSNGKYAKHTIASAQDGRNVYYQNGLDWNKVRGMQDGGEVNPYNQFRDYNPFPVETPKTKEDLGVYGVDVFAGKPMEAYHFNQSYWNAQDITPRKGEIQLQDPRNIPSTQRMNPKVDREAVMNLVQGAKERGLDPATVLAMSLQESNINKFNPLGDNAQEMDTYETMKKYATKYPKGISSKTISDESLNNLVKQFDYAKKLGKKSEADIIQGWNGYGTMNFDKRPMYGLKGIVDPNKNPFYGNRILDLREKVIKKNPELLKLLQEGSLASLEQGGSVQMKNQLVNLDQLTNFTNYNKSKNWLSKYE